MFLKQTSYKPRSNSLSSANDNPSSPTMSNNDNSNTNTVSGGKNASNSNALPSANRGGTGAAPTPANNVGGGAGWGDGGFTSGGRRRVSYMPILTRTQRPAGGGAIVCGSLPNVTCSLAFVSILSYVQNLRADFSLSVFDKRGQIFRPQHIETKFSGRWC